MKTNEKIDEIIKREEKRLKYSVIILGIMTITMILLTNIFTLLAYLMSILFVAISYASLNTAQEIKEATQ